MRLPFIIALPLLAATLSACHSNQAPTAPDSSKTVPEATMNQPATLPEENNTIAMGCIATEAGPIMGKIPTPELIEQARIGTKAQTVRVLKLGEPMTMDYNGGRLNILLDAQGKIQGVNCG